MGYSDKAKDIEAQAKAIRKARLDMMRLDRAKQQLKDEKKKSLQYKRDHSLAGKILGEGWKMGKSLAKAAIKEAKKK